MLSKNREIELLKERIIQLTEENKILAQNSSEEVQQTIKDFHRKIQEYNKLLAKMNKELDYLKNKRKSVQKITLIEKVKFLGKVKKIEKKMNKYAL